MADSAQSWFEVNEHLTDEDDDSLEQDEAAS
jgi:hypothetical protein